jgi:LuxR family transcriptional regulator, quorum-sensing system regulator BjaR1
VNLEETISSIESCATIEELRLVLQQIAGRYGFAGFNFLDVGRAADQKPYYFGTSGKQWESDYIANNFAAVDPCLHIARTSNLPFRWDQLQLPKHKTGRKSGAIKTMEAARDHGFTDGIVIPHHFVDQNANTYSALVVFFWKDPISKLIFKLKEQHAYLHIIVIYWINRLIYLKSMQRDERDQLKASSPKYPSTLLTDRESDALSWAARGKTNSETAEILNISEQTIEFHIRNASRKLSATNKTQAVAIALTLGLILI